MWWKPKTLAKKEQPAPSREDELLAMMADIKEQIAGIYILTDGDFNEDVASMNGLRLNALEEAYFILFNELRALRGFESFKDVRDRLKDLPCYEDIKDKYQLDKIGINKKFIGEYNYQASEVAS